MNKLQAFLFALGCCAIIALGTPFLVALSFVVLPLIASMNLWQFAALMAVVAFPFFYLMFRKTHVR